VISPLSDSRHALRNITLLTDRLLLREFAMADLESVHEYASDQEVVRLQAWGPNKLEETQKFLSDCIGQAQCDARSTFNLAIALQEGSVIGGCLAVVREDGHEAEIGYTLNRKYWGLGYATEAVQRLIAFLFHEIGVHRVFATCGPNNVASIRVLEKNGMQLEGRLRCHKLMRGSWRDSLIWARLSDDPFTPRPVPQDVEI
jgi:[ribosomal protein S5]-alanine N-acetyltransferase